MLMKSLRIFLACLLALAAAMLIQGFAVFASQKEKVIYSTQATGVNGAPTVWATDESGNLYGVTFSTGHGVVFELSPDGNGWTEKTLHTFLGSPDGLQPTGLVRDSAGNLYGTTSYGGTHTNPKCFAHCGIAFELSPNSNGSWTETILYDFTGGVDGGNPWSGLVFDKAGNLYGITPDSGSFNKGTVFRLSPSNGSWTFTLLYNFGDSGKQDGKLPFSNVTIDSAGNLYGTTSAGGPLDAGIAYELTPSAAGDWTETILYKFGSVKDDGTYPRGGLIFDPQGNLYGVTSHGGGQCIEFAALGCGTVFELTPTQSGWQETTLYRFFGYPDAADLEYTPVFDSGGNLYGASSGGGPPNCLGLCGVVFKLAPTQSGWTETVLHSFTGSPDGNSASSSLIFGRDGLLYGGTGFGGTGQCKAPDGITGCGTIYEVQP
jgi:uncharacterized repeat protein (TIGR03803 family)